MMSRNSKFATISVAVFVGLLAAYLGGYQNGKNKALDTDTEQATLATPETPTLAQTTEPRSNGEQSATEVEAIDPDDVDPANIDWAAIRARSPAGDTYDPMLLRWSDLYYSPEEIAAFNKLAVLPFNPKVGEECTPTVILESEPGAFVAENCLPVFEHPAHPYEQLPLDELIDLAATDAEAAVFASRKLDHPRQIVEFAVRASALSAKPGPIMAVAHGRFSPAGAGSTPEQTERYANETTNRIILERVAAVLGDPRANPKVQEERLANFTKTPEQLQKVLDLIAEQTQKVLDEMVEIERSTTGSTAVWEKINA